MRIAMGVTKPRKPILGGYFAGEIVDTGKQVTKFTVGEQVFGCARLRMGAYAEYMSLPESYTIVPKPDNISFEEAAAVPLGGLNALHFLNKANIQHGEKVLINGAGGSIGTFGVQIAKVRGAEVTAVDSAVKEDMLRRIGADHFINYQERDFTSDSHKYDIIFDMVASGSYSGCIRALSPRGRYLMANPRLADMFKSALTTKFTDRSVIFEFAGEKPGELLELKRMIEDGQIKPVVDKIYSMEQAVEAHRRVETEQRLGCVVLSNHFPFQ
jgi:NADPH:quinone reductase-like Zn-dependent oxidoreductase